MSILRGAGTLTAALLLAACSSGPDRPEGSDTEGPDSESPTVASLDLSGLPVPRAEVCAALPEDGVEQALDGPVTGTGHYGNGDDVEITPGYVDVSHEYGCAFTAADGTTAKVWIFARPVSRSEGRTLVRRARARRDCAFPALIGFGRPGLNSVCDVDGSVRARLEGLFGDTWVGCEVTEPHDAGWTPADGPDVAQRVQQWCTEVVTTVAAG